VYAEAKAIEFRPLFARGLSLRAFSRANFSLSNWKVDVERAPTVLTWREAGIKNERYEKREKRKAKEEEGSEMARGSQILSHSAQRSLQSRRLPRQKLGANGEGP